jgi:hypothetical protein
MFRKKDPYSYTQFWSLFLNTKDNDPQAIGFISLEYQVALYNDVQVLDNQSVNQPPNQQFILTCTQRILLTNPNNSSVAPVKVDSSAGEAFNNYPVLLTASISIPTTSTDGLTLNLLDYSPHTVNTAVQQNTSTGTSTGTEASSSSTTGSSHAQSSSYTVSATVGGSYRDGLSASVTGSYEHGSTVTTDNSKTAGKSLSNSADSSSSASMSIKDWGSYASVNPFYTYPSWVFGQEFPWNAIECRYASQEEAVNSYGQVPMCISASMKANLYDQVFLYPPSELSMFGLNFVMTASWRVYVEYGASTEITLNHFVDYYSASHTFSDGSVKVYMDLNSTKLEVEDETGKLVPPSITLDLNIMGLDPLGVNSDAAIVGFIPSKFIPPVSGTAPAPQTFKTISATNDLIIENTTDYSKGDISGFTVSQTCLTALWSDAQDFAYQITLFFKIIDSVNDYTLYIKHWLTKTTGVRLQVVVNGDTSNTITKYVDAIEGEGGDNNLLSIALRNLDFASIEYHDYLRLGLNSVTITMEPIDQGWSSCGYQIRAVSIVKG